jgi:hypothetical protein
VSWLLHVLGVDDVSGRWYAFWSGAGSDISELAIVGALLAIVRKHTCHVGRCWRIGRAPVDGTPWHVCWRHHPAGRPTHAHIISLHRQHTARLAAQEYRRAGTPAPPPPDASGERFYNHERDGL